MSQQSFTNEHESIAVEPLNAPETLRVLVVDDSKNNAFVILKLFDTYFPNVQAEVSHSALDALSFLLSHEVDLVLSDVSMPEMDGFEFVRYMRMNQRLKELPVIFITAFQDNRDWQRIGLDLGAIDYMFKPIDVNVFVLKMRNFLRLLQLQKDLKTSKAELQAKTDQLIERSRHAVMGEMIAMISHQWRQPLAVLTMNADIVRLKFNQISCISEPDKEFFEGRFHIIKSMLLEQAKLIQDFSDFFKPDKEKKIFSLQASIGASLDMVESHLTSHGITVHLDIMDDLDIYGIERELRQVIINIVKNAVDQLIAQQIDKPQVWISAVRKNNLIEMSIEDNGGGIAVDYLPTIFDAYVSTKSLNGTGLGLYMSKMIITDHFDGEIFASNTTAGARFTIFFPLKQAPSDHV